MKAELNKYQEAEAKFAGLNVVLVGLPGSGKSSLMDSLSIAPNYLSLGDITRKELNSNGAMAEAIREKFKSVDPWPADFVIGIITSHLIKAKNGFVLDGIPRKSSEASALIEWTATHNIPIDLLLHLQINPKITLDRIATRNNSGRLETAAHYESRMNAYLAEEEDMLEILKKGVKRSLTINTDNNPAGFAKSVLLDFVLDNF